MAFGDRSVKLFLKGDATGLERALTKAEVRLKGFERVAGKQSTVANSGLLGGFSKSGALVTGIGLGVIALKNVTDAAKNAQVILGQTSTAVTDAGLSWNKYGAQVQAASLRISKSSAFDDEQVLQSFATFVRGQKNVEKSLQLSELAADVARGRYTDLATATQLVNKAALGQIGALRRAGIAIDKNATSTQALAALQAAYGGAAVRYANSAAGAQDKLRVSVENLRESLGNGLLPVVTDLATVLSNSVDQANALAAALGKVGLSSSSLEKLFKAGLALNPITQIISAEGFLGGKLGIGGGGKKPTIKQPGIADTLAAEGVHDPPSLTKRGSPQTTNPTKAAAGSKATFQPIPVALQLNETNARLSGNRSTLKGALSKEAEFLQSRIAKGGLAPDKVLDLKQALLGVTEEIKSIDDQIIQDANDKKNALREAKDAQKAAHKRALEALQAQAQAFKQQADDIKSAVLNAFDTKTAKIDNARRLAEAKKTLKQARQLGGAGSIKIAQQGLFDANRAIQRQRIEDTTFRVTGGPSGPVNTVSIGNVTINVNTSDPDKAGAAVLKALQRSSRHNTVQGRGRIQGKSLGVN